MGETDEETERERQRERERERERREERRNQGGKPVRMKTMTRREDLYSLVATNAQGKKP